MFQCNTPPFRPRPRRGPCRGWRPHNGQPSYGASGRFRSPPFGFFAVCGPFLHDDFMEAELEDVGGEYYFSRAVPGISPDSLHVDIQGPLLTVRTLTEVPGQRFKWQVLVPEDVQVEDISAEITDGLLRVRLPKQTTRIIPVTSTTSGSSRPGERTERSHGNRTSDLWQLENWGSEYRLTHPAPGCRPEDVVVEVDEGFVFVKCHGKHGKFSGEFNLPPAVDVDTIMVEIIDKVLVVTLPKIERGSFRIHCRQLENDSGPSAPPQPGPSAPTANEPIDEDDSLYEAARLI